MCSCGIVVRADGKERSTARRRGKEGQKGTAALRAAPPLQNPAESRLGRAHREAPPRRHWKTPWKAASDEPIGKHRRGVRTRYPMAGGWQRKKYGRAAGREGQKGTAALRAAPPLENPAEARLRRAHREAPPRRPCKTPQKAASDEPFGEHRLGDRARHPMAGRLVKKEVRPGGGGEKDKRERRRCAQCRRWKTPWEAASDEPIGKHRLGGPAKPRRRPPQTSPSASIASATLEKPAMFAPATRL